MKRIAAIAGILVLLSFAPVYGEPENSTDEKKYLPAEAEIETVQNEDATVFTLRNGFRGEGNGLAASYLTRYYFEEGGFREVIISCFLAIETAFPSDEYDAASRQVREIYDAFAAKAVSEEYLYISVRFEKNIPPGGIITVEFLNHANYFQRAGRNFFTGITDIVSSPLELPMGMIDESKKSGMVTGVPRGVFSGFGQALRKAGTGAIKLLTFWAG